MAFRSTILMTEFVTHDVKRFIMERPAGFSFVPGQGVELVIDRDKWRQEEGRPFTPTCRTTDRVLEFTIKRYAGNQGVTDKLHTLHPGDAVLLSEPFGTINYKGPGIFIAAGAGLTPFLAIFRQLADRGEMDQQFLIFSNKTRKDIICEKELVQYFGTRHIFTCTRESAPAYDNRHVDRAFLEEKIQDLDRYFYVCGPDDFVEAINAGLGEMGLKTEYLVFEQ
jgi:cytochrome-b5 reductase